MLASLALACSAEEEPPVASSSQPSEATSAPEPLRSAPNPPSPDETYVGSVECGRCHADQLARWTGSHHDLAMQTANETTVLGDFEASFSQGDALFQFSRRDGKYWVDTANADGESEAFEIAYTFGITPLQQYLVRMPRGRYQALSVAWDTRPAAIGGQRWFHLYPDDGYKPGDPFHWTGGYQTWNHMCAECHSTNLEKHFDAAADTYATTWSEIDVACEACHGPGSGHVENAVAGVAAPGGLRVDYVTSDSRYEVDTCARCHARRHRISAEDRTGRPLFDDFAPATLRAGLYHSDGQIDEEVYVYGSFVQSPMYARGVACSDCHDPHSLELRASGNALCTQCHAESGNTRFPTLTKQAYDTPDHHFHPTGSTGAECVNCHMPSRTYMQVDPRRDHSFRVPRPDLSVKLGTPNACSGCHTDQSAGWASEAITTWYGPQGRQSKPHFGETFDSARKGAQQAIPELAAIASDSERPAVVRATALELLSAFGPSTAPVAIEAMDDADPWVRATAARSLAFLEPQRQVALGAPLLRDPRRAVRIEAGRVLAAVDIESPSVRRALDSAVAEYTEAQRAEADTPSAHLNLAVLAAGRGDPEGAIAAYREAIRLDPDFFPARANLAVLFGALDRRNEAELLLREGIAREPDRGEFHYSLGLVLAEGERFEAAAGHIGRAAELMPTRARVQYNHGLALQRIGQDSEAERALLAATRLAPSDPEIVYALAAFYIQRGRWEDALAPAKRLVELTGGAPQPSDLLREVERALGNSTDGGQVRR